MGIKYSFAIMTRESIVPLSPEQIQIHHRLFIANVKLIKIVSDAIRLQPNFEALIFIDSVTGENVLEVDRDFLRILQSANHGLYNELAHPQKQTIRNGKVVFESGTDYDVVLRLHEEARIIKDPKTAIDLREIFYP